MSRPPLRPSQSKQAEPEDLFNMTVSFNDDEPDITVSEVAESELAEIYRYIGEPTARIRIQPRPGFHYLTAASRIKHVTATLIEETSN